MLPIIIIIMEVIFYYCSVNGKTFSEEDTPSTLQLAEFIHPHFYFGVFYTVIQGGSWQTCFNFQKITA